MASVYFFDLPGDWKEFKSEGTDVKVSAGLQGTLDSHGTLDAGAVYQKFTLVLPIGDGGDLPNRCPTAPASPKCCRFASSRSNAAATDKTSSSSNRRSNHAEQPQTAG